MPEPFGPSRAGRYVRHGLYLDEVARLAWDDGVITPSVSPEFSITPGRKPRSGQRATRSAPVRAALRIIETITAIERRG